MEEQNKKRFKINIYDNKFEIVLFLAFLVYLVIARAIIPIYKLHSTFLWDWDFYEMMAKDPSIIFRNEIIAPFCYRPLVPFLAWIIPFDSSTSFAIINFTSSYIAGILLFYTLKIEFDTLESSIGLFLFCSLNFPISICPPCIYEYKFIHLIFYLNYVVDGVGYLFVMCCFYCILKHHKFAYCLLLVFGVLAKEVVLFTIPIFIIYELLNDKAPKRTKKRLKVLVKPFCSLLKYIIPSLLLFVMLRIAIRPASITQYVNWDLIYQGNPYGSWDLIKLFIDARLYQWNSGYNFYFYSLCLWGPFLLFLACFNRLESFSRWVKYYGVFIACVYLQLLMAYNFCRILSIGFFPMIHLAISGFHEMRSSALELLNSKYHIYFTY
ncbi:MAG: hypothetical protein JW891_04255 [Candidatus Lokiarchaeota archaeon]|nr:hypothetical protein [Candidatus Lokiarchaeota archaeon]